MVLINKVIVRKWNFQEMIFCDYRGNFNYSQRYVIIIVDDVNITFNNSKNSI